MFKALRSRLRLSPTAVIATLALVFAMTGGAYAAKKYLITSTKQISPSVLKALQGKAGRAGANGAAGAQGAAGAAGPQGPAGPAGGTGPKGENGTNGTDGTDGTEGKAGESVTIGTPSSNECKEGGVKLSNSTGAKHVCNGSPWTVGGTLPPGKTEYGTWSFRYPVEGGESIVPLSFNVPLSASLVTSGCYTETETPPGTLAGPCHAHFINKNGQEVVLNEDTSTYEAIAPSEDCKGGTVEHPVAAPGSLCVYEKTMTGGKVATFEVLPSGALVAVQLQKEGHEPGGKGTWAVTEEE